MAVMEKEERTSRKISLAWNASPALSQLKLVIQPLIDDSLYSDVELDSNNLRPIGVRPLDWLLLQYIYDRFFRYGRPCFMTAWRISKDLTHFRSSQGSIRQSRHRLKKAGLIQVENPPSQRRPGTLSVITLTEDGAGLMKEFFARKTPEKEKKTKKSPQTKPVQSKKTCPASPTGDVRPKPAKRYSLFDYRASRRFAKQIQRSFPIKGSATWTEDWAVVLRQLREIDGFTEKEIQDTLDYIVSDNIPQGGASGFCYAKVMRSATCFRSKWRDGMSKFAHACSDMKSHKLDNPDPNDEDSIPDALRLLPDGSIRKIGTPPRSEDSEFRLHKMVNEAYENFMNLPHPEWKISDQRFREWEQLCFDTALLLEEFVEDRGWNSQLFSIFFEVLEVDNKKLKFYTADILREKILVFFNDRAEQFFVTTIGYYNQIRMVSNGGPAKETAQYFEDDTFRIRAADFVEDQKQGIPFDRATEIIPDEEIVLDEKYRHIEKGTFNV